MDVPRDYHNSKSGQSSGQGAGRKFTFPVRWHLVGAVGLACIFLWLQSRSCSLHPGRDMITYWASYREIFRVNTEAATLLLFRPPFTPLFFGTLFDLFGAAGVKVVLSFLYVLCLVTVFVVGAGVSVWVGYLALILLGADIQYYYWFFSVGSESPQSFLLVLWLAYAFFTFRKTEARYWIVHAAVVWLLILNRPGNQVMILCALFPLVNFDTTIKRRLSLSLVFLISYGTLHISYSSYNYLRVGAFQVSTLGNAHMPFFRLYLQDRMIRPENGPKSRELAKLVDDEILPLEVYRQYRIDRDIFFTYASQRMYNQLVATVGRVYGWDHQWLILRQAAMEAVENDPVEFLLTYVDHLRDVFYIRGDGRFDLSSFNRTRPDYNALLKKRYAFYKQLGLDIPSEGDLLPRAKESRVDAIVESYTEQTFFRLKKNPVEWTIPGRYCAYHWGNIFDIYGITFPFTFFFLCIGMAGVVFWIASKQYVGNIEMLSITSVAFATLATTLMGSVQFPFRFPYDSIFILFGCFGIYGMYQFLKIFIKIRLV
ncbi:hypothetical protein ACFL0S_02645 [Thermodesulfobacteriota bacterium]